MAYSIKWSKESVKDLESLDFSIAQRIVAKVSWLGENFERIMPERLSNVLKHLYKIRVGDYRAVYAVENKEIVIKYVGHRRDIYKKIH